MDYIKLYRCILDWEWWHDINTFRIFVFLLLKANWRDTAWKGKIVKRGSYISSYDKLANDTDMTKDEVRTAIKHLKLAHTITTQSTRNYTVFTVVNYELYQCNPTQEPTPIPYESHTIPTKIRNKEVKKERNNNIYMPPTVLQVAEYCAERKNNVDASAFVDFYTANGWVQGKGKPIKDWKAAVRTWEKREAARLPKTNKFNQFKQNQYDFDSIEKELLGN